MCCVRPGEKQLQPLAKKLITLLQSFRRLCLLEKFTFRPTFLINLCLNFKSRKLQKVTTFVL
jgi:hypothetical protein